MPMRRKHHEITPGANDRGRPLSGAGKRALRWLAGVSVIALLATTGVGVAQAFADMAREDALAGAYRQATTAAARAAGGNPGSNWASLLETPSGRRSLALWQEALMETWPGACAEALAAVSQPVSLCLPQAGLLEQLIDARHGAGVFAALSANAAVTAQERTRDAPEETFATAPDPIVAAVAPPRRASTTATPTEPLDWRAYEPPPAASAIPAASPADAATLAEEAAQAIVGPSDLIATQPFEAPPAEPVTAAPETVDPTALEAVSPAPIRLKDTAAGPQDIDTPYDLSAYSR